MGLGHNLVYHLLVHLDTFKTGNISASYCILYLIFMCKTHVPSASMVCTCHIHPGAGHHRSSGNDPLFIGVSLLDLEMKWVIDK